MVHLDGDRGLGDNSGNHGLDSLGTNGNDLGQMHGLGLVSLGGLRDRLGGLRGDHGLGSLSGGLGGGLGSVAGGLGRRLGGASGLDGVLDGAGLGHGLGLGLGGLKRSLGRTRSDGDR